MLVWIKYSFFCALFISNLCIQSISASLLNQDQLLLIQKYQLDRSYMENFPFSSYQVVKSSTQGQFYIDNQNRNDSIKSTLISKDIWEKEIMEVIHRYVKPHTIAIDIGAHIGTHAMLMSRCVRKNGCVIAFEPQAKLNRELTLNARLNRCYNLIPIHAALGKENGVTYLGPVLEGNEGGRCISSHQLIEKVPLLALDGFHFDSVSFMKIDAECYELEVLEGAYDTIMRNRPIIMIEIGGGMSRIIEESVDLKKHLADVIYMLENILNYEVTVISEPTSDYLAIPK